MAIYSLTNFVAGDSDSEGKILPDTLQYIKNYRTNEYYLFDATIGDVTNISEGIVFPGSLIHEKNYTTSRFTISGAVIADIGPGSGGDSNLRPSSGFIYPRGIC